MAGNISIISSDVITQTHDVFWSDLPEGINVPKETSLLILTTKLIKDSNEEIQLNKIIQACKIDETKVCTVQLENNIAWHKLRDLIKPEVVVLFGILPQYLGISVTFQLFYPNNFDGCIWIPSVSLTEMEQHPDVKKLLWIHGLKPVFIDKTTGNI